MRGRRQGVSAEISQISQSQEDQKPIASHAKSSEDSQFLLACMSSNPLFQHLSSASMDTVVEAFFLAEKQDGDVVMKQGTDGDNFYVIQEGSVKIIVNDNQVASKSAGTSFGELALMYNAPRTATIVCDGRAKLWALDRASFQTIMRSTESSRNSTVASLRPPAIWESCAPLCSLLKQFPGFRIPLPDGSFQGLVQRRVGQNCGRR
jgi:cAMP-dependent protein kinase regulator